MTQGELMVQAPANILFPGTVDAAQIARVIGEEMLRPFGVALARAEIQAQADSFWGKVRPGTLSVTAVGVDGTQITRYSAKAQWPHDQQASTALEEAISTGQAKWKDTAATYTLTLCDAPELPNVFRHSERCRQVTPDR